MSKKKKEKAPTIGLAESNPLVAQFIKSMIIGNNGYEMVGVADNYSNALKLAQEVKPDILILDVSLVGGSGFDLARDIKNSNLGVKLILMAETLLKKHILQALKVNVSGFINKLYIQEQMSEAISAILNGKKYFSKECTDILLNDDPDADMPSGSDRSAMLTTREREILSLIAKDKSIAVIADELCVSPRTVETHKRNIMNKLKVNTTVGLVRLVYENRIKI